MEIKSTEFFRNMKSLPPEGSDEFKQLIKWEIDKITGGVTINGIFISGWLYWHINHWWIRVDALDEYNNIIRNPQLPELRDNEWIRAEYLEKCKHDKKGYMEVGGRQSGKDLLNSSLLYTPTGEITIGDCNIGDRIYDDSGNLTTILAKYPQGVKPVYKVSLIDGRELYCGLEHNWYVYHRKSKKYKVKTTSELLKDYKKERPDWKGVRKNSYEFRYSIPNNACIKYLEKELPIDPYILGLWLGDGSNSYSKITTIDPEIIDSIYEYAKKIGLQVTIDGIDTFMITSGKMGGNNTELKDKNILHNWLKELHLYNNKHIPNIYLHSSEEQRMELLKGLMDSDGSCTEEKGSIEFSSSIPKLAEDFYSLCRGLGINLSKVKKSTSYKKDGVKINCKDSIRFALFTDKEVFKLKRKLERLKSKPKYLKNTAISKIEYVFDAETTCIVVDNDSHLFLTDNYTITHNSEMEASYFGMNSTIFENTQNLIVCGNDDDLSLLKDKVDFGLKRLWKGIAIPRLDKTWRLNQIRLGYKDAAGEDQIWSYIIIRNARDGHNTEAGAGTTAKTVIFDEVGKYLFASSFKAVEPAIKSKFGWRTVPILVGTGGSFNNGKDAENFFYNPDSNNFLSVDSLEKNSKTAIFLSGLYRLDCKEEMKLGDWLISRGIEIEDISELNNITIEVSNKEKANQLIEDELEKAKHNPDRTLFLKQKMYYPRTTDECFLRDKQNIFDIEAAKRQKNRLTDQGRTGTPVILFHDGEKINHEFTDKQAITNFPLRPNDSKDAPVIIYEFPMENPPYGLYVAGVDPYRQGQAAYSQSLGSVYIYKRMHSLTGENFQEMFVASYCARPDKKETWEEQARLLIKYYNARTLCENDEISFIEYMKTKGDAHYLEKQPQWLMEIVPNSTVKREYGVHRTATKVIDYLHTCFKKYMEDVIYTEKDEEGKIIREVFGISKIFDPVLLEEVIQYDDDGNFDRIIAAELAIAQALKMDPIMGKIGGSGDVRVKAMNRKVVNPLFLPARVVRGHQRKLFT